MNHINKTVDEALRRIASLRADRIREQEGAAKAEVVYRSMMQDIEDLAKENEKLSTDL